MKDLLDKTIYFKYRKIAAYHNFYFVKNFPSLADKLDGRLLLASNLLKDMFFIECTKFTYFYIMIFISINGNLIKL